MTLSALGQASIINALTRHCTGTLYKYLDVSKLCRHGYQDMRMSIHHNKEVNLKDRKGMETSFVVPETGLDRSILTTLTKQERKADCKLNFAISGNNKRQTGNFIKGLYKGKAHLSYWQLKTVNGTCPSRIWKSKIPCADTVLRGAGICGKLLGLTIFTIKRLVTQENYIVHFWMEWKNCSSSLRELDFWRNKRQWV